MRGTSLDDDGIALAEEAATADTVAGAEAGDEDP